MSNAMLAHSPKSRIRRKPITTYKSPSANDIDPFIVLSTRCEIPSPSTRPSQIQGISSRNARTDHSPRRISRTKGYELPLYHPLGELALSLPPLNPADYGLPLPRFLEDESQKTSTLSQGAPLKVSDAEEDEDISIPTVSSIAAVAANEMKRGSPRKRRGVGNGKRRRRDVDDGDATYPAKRTRQARGGEDDNDLDDVQGQADGDGTQDLDGQADRRPERRSTRSRTKRRDSSEIDSIDERALRDSAPVLEENVKHNVLEGISEEVSGGKEEEGESDDGGK